MTTTWTPVTKTDDTQTEQDLLIEGGFKLLIGDGYYLQIQEFKDTSWSQLSKTTAPAWTTTTKTT